MSPREPRRARSAGEVLPLAALLLLAVAAPTPGDIGGCGAEAADLDAGKFFAFKAAIDCGRCRACGLSTASCERACEGAFPDAFPEGCYPLEHDGAVCLNALEAAGCAEYGPYVADVGATAPTECNFCPPGEAP